MILMNGCYWMVIAFGASPGGNNNLEGYGESTRHKRCTHATGGVKVNTCHQLHRRLHVNPCRQEVVLSLWGCMCFIVNPLDCFGYNLCGVVMHAILIRTLPYQSASIHGGCMVLRHVFGASMMVLSHCKSMRLLVPQCASLRCLVGVIYDGIIVNCKFCTSKLLGDQSILFILSNMIIVTRNFGGNCRLRSVVKDFDPGFEQLSDLGDVSRTRELQ